MTTADDRDPSLPRFRLRDVRKHDAASGAPWVTHDDKVYDITDWVAAHPGGDVILRAAGGSVDPYWDIFTIHKSDHVREILAQYLIGYVDAADLDADGRPAAEEVEDPFEQDPVRDPRLVTHTAKPRNAEPPNEELDREFRTPNELFYVRNHMWVPVVGGEEGDEKEGTNAVADADAAANVHADEKRHVLTVELPDGTTREYSLADLRSRFAVHHVTAALQCSGNRRSDMTRHAGRTNGLQWGVGAISNAEWEGVRLADVLVDAGLRVVDPAVLTRADSRDAPEQEGDDNGNTITDPAAHHVQFSGLEAYGASVPLATAMDPRGDVLLAFGMNGAPLPRDHGYPLRSIVPGHVAARSVKWLSRVVVADEESTSQWQRRDYKSFGPNEGADPDWDRARAIQEMPVTSAVTRVWVGDAVRRGTVPWLGHEQEDSAGKGVVDLAAVEKKVGSTTRETTPETAAEEPVAVQGYAYSGGGREITRVDVSLDGGRTWDQAELLDDWERQRCRGSRHWAWKRWRYVGRLPSRLPLLTAEEDGAEGKGRRRCTEIVVKATDDAYNTQPGDHRSIYNVRGNLATAWHRVKVCARCVPAGKDGAAAGESVEWSTAETYGCGFGTEGEGGDGVRASGGK